jgi:hypothetical protein
MTSDQVVRAVIATLEELAVPYMLVGSFSSNFYGIPRSTKDADFVVALGDTTIRTVADRLGPGFALDPQMSFETVTGTYRYILTAVGLAFTIEIFQLSDDPHDQERFRRRTRVSTPQGDAYLPTAEDVVVTKLRWSRLGKRTKDIDDVRSVLGVQGSRLDWDYVHLWCDEHGTRQHLDDVRRSVPRT